MLVKIFVIFAKILTVIGKNNGLVAINYVGCLLTVSCEDFKRKEDN